MATLINDLRLAGRLLLKDKWFTLAAVAALALGIAANNTVFTIVNGVLLRDLPLEIRIGSLASAFGTARAHRSRSAACSTPMLATGRPALARVRRASAAFSEHGYERLRGGTAPERFLAPLFRRTLFV